MKTLLGRVLLGCALLTIAVKSLATTADESLSQLYKQAKAAGQSQVVIYLPYGNLQPVWDAFAQAWPGITVRPAVISGGGAPLLARIRAEATSGNYTGDVVISGLGDIHTLQQEHRLEKDVPPQAASLPEQYKDSAGYYQIPFNTLFTLVYNPNLIKPEQLPQTFDEAVSQKSQGHFGYARFTGAAAPDLAGSVLFWNNAVSDEQLKQIKANGREVPTAIALLTNIAQGRLAYGLWAPTQNVKKIQQDGAPLAIHLLKDSAVLMGPGMAMLNHAPNKAAAQLLRGWLLSDAGQRALGELASSYGTQPGAPVPPGLPDVSDYAFKTIPLSHWEETLRAFRSHTQAIWGN